MSSNLDESEDLMRVRGIGPAAANRLYKAGIKTIEQLSNAKPSDLAFIKGIGVVSAKKIIANAQHLITLEKGLTIVLDKIKENFVKYCPKCSGDMEEKFIILGPNRKFPAYQCKLCKFYLPK